MPGENGARELRGARAPKSAASGFPDLAHFLPDDLGCGQDDALCEAVTAADFHIRITDVHHLNHDFVIWA